MKIFTDMIQTNQLELFSAGQTVIGRITFAPADPLPPFARNSETSRQAAIEKYNRNNSENQREMIFRWIKFCGEKGATREEIQEYFNLSGDTVRPRIKELLGEAKGWTIARIRRNGKMRKTKAGLNAEVLEAV